MHWFTHSALLRPCAAAKERGRLSLLPLSRESYYGDNCDILSRERYLRYRTYVMQRGNIWGTSCVLCLAYGLCWGLIWDIDFVPHPANPSLLLDFTVGVLRDFVRSHLADPELPFYLCKSSGFLYPLLPLQCRPCTKPGGGPSPSILWSDALIVGPGRTVSPVHGSGVQRDVTYSPQTNFYSHTVLLPGLVVQHMWTVRVSLSLEGKQSSPKPAFHCFGWHAFLIVTCSLTSVIAPPRTILSNENETLFQVSTTSLCLTSSLSCPIPGTVTSFKGRLDNIIISVDLCSAMANGFSFSEHKLFTRGVPSV